MARVVQDKRQEKWQGSPVEHGLAWHFTVKPANSSTSFTRLTARSPYNRQLMTTSRQALPTAEAAQARNWLHTARFLTTAALLNQLPELQVPEIAFVGRSNAGKSTCINTLTQQRQLAYASKTPGRTQHINLFELGKKGAADAVLTDLPGYGYAAVPREAKLRWQQVMASYLMRRENLRAVVMLCDSRHGLTELDERLLEIIRPRVQDGLDFVVLLTKADKLNRAEGQKALSIAKLQTAGGCVRLFSALKKTGVDEVSVLLQQWAQSGLPQPLPEAQAGEAEDEPPALDE